MTDIEYQNKVAELNTLIEDLNYVYDRASNNSLYSKWHEELLDQVKKLVEEINDAARKDGREPVLFDESKYQFTPGELEFVMISQEYDHYREAKADYDDKAKEYWEKAKEYNDGKITYEEYQSYALPISDYQERMKEARKKLLEDIREASFEDYIKRPQHEVNTYIEEIATYNQDVKKFAERYEQFQKDKDKKSPEELAKESEELKKEAERLKGKQKELKTNRKIIYNNTTKKQLETHKKILESIMTDSTNEKDELFTLIQKSYEEKLGNITDLLKEIKKFESQIRVSKFEIPDDFLDEEDKRGKGKGKGSGNHKPKPPEPTPDYDISPIDPLAFLGEHDDKGPDPDPDPDPEDEEDLDPIPPIPPRHIPHEPHLVVEHGIDLKELIAKIMYGAPPDRTIYYGKMDNFVYNHKDAKIVNFPKSHGVTLLDKPGKLIKFIPSVAINGIGKLIAKMGNLNSKVRINIEQLNQRLDNLTPEELEYLLNNFTSIRMTELGKGVPEVVISAIANKLFVYYCEKLETINARINDLYNDLITKYERYEELNRMLATPGLTPEQITAIEKEKQTLDRELCDDINGIRSNQKFANELNKGGTAAFLENWRARFNGSAGGRNISKKVDQTAMQTFAFTKVGDYVASGKGYLAARDLLFGDKQLIMGTETKHKARNWGHKTRVGAFEYKPFVEVQDYTKDTYLSDVFTSIVLAASINNMLYINRLKSELDAARQQLASLNSTVTAQQSEISALKAALQGRIDSYNAYIDKINADILANNQTLDELRKICSLYKTDPDAFVKGMTEFAKDANFRLQGSTEYTIMEADAGALGTTALRSSGHFYGLYDQQGHEFSRIMQEEINNIANNAALSTEQKARAMADVLGRLRTNYDSILPSMQSDILKGLAMPANKQWDFSALTHVVQTAGQSDPTFITNVFNEYLEAAIKTSNLQGLADVLHVDISDIPIEISQIPAFTASIPTANLAPAIVVLASNVGRETALAIAEKPRTSSKESKKKWAEKTEELADRIANLNMDLEETAREIFEEHMEEWNSKGPFYRLKHRKEKPTMYQAYAEARENIEDGGLGR